MLEVQNNMDNREKSSGNQIEGTRDKAKQNIQDEDGFIQVTGKKTRRTKNKVEPLNISKGEEEEKAPANSVAENK